MPASKNNLVQAPLQVIKDTIRIIDTVYQRDSISIRDTLTLLTRDTVTRIIAPTPVPAAMQKEKTPQQIPFDYTAIPADILLFDLGRSTIRPVYFSRLNYIAGILMKQTGLQVMITGHTDKSGSPEVNSALSIKRAKNVEQYLMNKGVPKSQLSTGALSFFEPAVAGSSTSASSQNRRVVIRIVNK